jgi:uncharacterized membrane protein
MMMMMMIIIIIIIIIIQFFIISVPNQQLQGQLQTQHSVDKSNYIMHKHKVKDKLQASNGGKNTLIQKSKEKKKRR